jgi:hypothetical protein
MVAFDLLRQQPPSAVGAPTEESGRLTVFLLLWLGVEVAAYFPLTPFGAVRRVLGIVIVATLLTGRVLARTFLSADDRRNVHVILAGGVLLGFAYAALDYWGAKVQQLAADEAVAWIEAQGGKRVWYMGHWGFQYYAEHRGMKPVYLGGERVMAGDYLVVPDLPHNQQSILLDVHDRPSLDVATLGLLASPLSQGPLVASSVLFPGRADAKKLVEEYVVVEQDPIPLRTVSNFYGGTTALQHHEGPRLTVRVYRVIQSFDPQPLPSPQR